MEEAPNTTGGRGGASAGRPSPLVDVHAHFTTPRFVEQARAAGHERPDGLPAWPRWDEQRHLDLMDRWGVGVSMLSMSTPGTHFGDDAAARALSREVNETGAEICARHPDRFGLFASLPLPDVEGAVAEARYALDDLGCDGVVLMTNALGRYLGHPGFEPLHAELDRRRAVVLVHPTSPRDPERVALGRPRPMLEFIFDTARTASDLLFNGVFERYPDIEWIFPHSGGALPVLADRMELFRSAFGHGGGFDGSGAGVIDQLRRLWYDMAATPFPRQIPALAAAFGHDRILYGSDHCWLPPAAIDAQLASIDAAAGPTPELTWRALTSENARRLFPRRAV